MKRIALIATALFALPAAQAQRPPFIGAVDTLTRPSYSEIGNIVPDIADTLKHRPHRVNFGRTFSDAREKDGALSLTFDITEYGEWQYAFPLRLSRQVASDITFEIDWAMYVQRGESGAWAEYDPHYVYLKEDTIFTEICPAESGGITPEGQRFAFTGGDVSSVESRTKYVLSVEQCILEDRNYREMWTEHIEEFESPWMNCGDGNFGYIRPVVDKADIDKEGFDRIKAKAVAVQKRYLFDEYDSIVNTADSPEGVEYIIGVLEKFKEVLKPNPEDARTFSDMSILIELSHFITEVRVHLKSGEVKNFVHFAGYTASMP